MDFETEPVKDDHVGPDDGLAYDADADTCFTSVSGITGTSVQAGGVTERLKSLGIDTKAIATSEATAETQDGKSKSKPKLVKVCPECASWNKEYMSWCADCGEILIGVEVIDAKLKKKKEREQRRQQNRLNLANKTSVDEMKLKGLETDQRHFEQYEQIEQQSAVLNETNGECVMERKPVTETEPVKHVPDLDKSEVETSPHSTVESRNNLLPFVRTERDINDICESITDPTIKGFLKSYFRKKSQAAQDVIRADELNVGESSSQMVSTDQNELAINVHSLVAWAEVEEKTKENEENEQDEIEVEIFEQEESRPSESLNRNANVVPTLNLVGSSDEDEGKKKPFKPLSFSIDSDDWTSVADRSPVRQSQAAVLKPYNVTSSIDPPRPRNAFLSYLLETKAQTPKPTLTRPRSADMLERKRRQAQNRAQESTTSCNVPRQGERPGFSQGVPRSAVRRDGGNIDDGSTRASIPLRKARPASADVYRR